MLRIIQNTSAGVAKNYFSTADYYSEGVELDGVWRGDAAKRLNLSGQIQKEDWDALCDNRNPESGLGLTSRRKDNRRVGYDFNFHCPKGVSLLCGLTKDERILQALRESVRETMDDMEKEVQARVRKDGRNESRTTGNWLYGEYVHTTSRPVDGIPDPHCHVHCFVHNATWDSQENKWKAVDIADIKRDASYFQAVFHSKLARKLEELGLPVERKRHGWDLADLSKGTLDKFSRRTALIEALAKELGITDAAEKDKLGATTRERKAKGLSFDELQKEWRSRLTADESSTISGLANQIGGPARAERDDIAGKAALNAVDHCFERNSVIAERRLLTEALKRSVGAASLATVSRHFSDMNLIHGERDGRRLVTTREVLDEEQQMIEFARDGRGTCPALGDALYAIKRDWLNDGQRQAVRHLLTSNDRVLVISGGAGTGKTSMAQEAVEAIQAGGKRVYMFAPSAEASRGVLRADGFLTADTVARLLVDKRLQQEMRGQVIWVDEAGLLGTRQMAEVFDLADRLDVRVILSGDRRQHGPVDRGEALRLLEQEAGLVPAQLREILRQKEAYKDAVKALSEGRVELGFRQLDKLGMIKQVDGKDRYEYMARDYVASVAEGKKVLVVSPTHLEGEWITSVIRERLKASDRLGKKERSVLTLRNLNLTLGEREDSFNYEPGDVLVFHQNAKGYRKGERLVVGMNPVPVIEASKFQVYRPDFISLAAGDIVRFTRNSKTLDCKHALNNGQTFTVRDFDAKGNIILQNGWKVARDIGFLNYGYCLTSYASQGRTVDKVIIGESAQSFGAASAQQFYVSVSRAREKCTLYTDQKEDLLKAVCHADQRLSATEFVQQQRRERIAKVQRISRQLERQGVANPSHADDREIEHGR